MTDEISIRSGLITWPNKHGLYYIIGYVSHRDGIRNKLIVLLSQQADVDDNQARSDDIATHA